MHERELGIEVFWAGWHGLLSLKWAIMLCSVLVLTASASTTVLLLCSVKLLSYVSQSCQIASRVLLISSHLVQAKASRFGMSHLSPNSTASISDHIVSFINT